MAYKVFNSPAYVKPCVVDVAHKLLGSTNWVFLDGKAHADYRRGLNGLFTRQALETYLPEQEEVYDDYYARFLALSKEAGKPIPFMNMFREVITAVSCRTFVGHYISDDAIKKIADDYYMITAALELVNFPIILPFTKTWYGKKASDMVLNEFAKCAAKSKVRMAAGGSVTCILDGWVKNMIDSESYRQKLASGVKIDPEEKPTQVIRNFTDYEIAQTLFTFLFASQDATSSASTWLFQIMADRPDVLDKLRQENIDVRNGDLNARYTMDMLEKMTYTRAVVKETLRYRPPVLMVPYEVKKDFPITADYTIKKGMCYFSTLCLVLTNSLVFRLHGSTNNLPRSARPRSLPQPRIFRARQVDYRYRRATPSQLARFRHWSSLLLGSDLCRAQPHAHGRKGFSRAGLGARDHRAVRADQGLCHHFPQG